MDLRWFSLGAVENIQIYLLRNFQGKIQLFLET